MGNFERRFIEDIDNEVEIPYKHKYTVKIYTVKGEHFYIGTFYDFYGNIVIDSPQRMNQVTSYIKDIDRLLSISGMPNSLFKKLYRELFCYILTGEQQKQERIEIEDENFVATIECG